MEGALWRKGALCCPPPLNWPRLMLPIRRMSVDIFPALNLPVIYVCQPYGGMDPAQMEGLLTNYYEYHFVQINGKWLLEEVYFVDDDIKYPAL